MTFHDLYSHKNNSSDNQQMKNAEEFVRLVSRCFLYLVQLSFSFWLSVIRRNKLQTTLLPQSFCRLLSETLTRLIECESKQCRLSTSPLLLCHCYCLPDFCEPNAVSTIGPLCQSV
jgi:hypothetical protein